MKQYILKQYIKKAERLAMVKEIREAIGFNYAYQNQYPINSKGIQKGNYKYEHVNKSQAEKIQAIANKYGFKNKYVDYNQGRSGRCMIYFDYAKVEGEEAPKKETPKAEPKHDEKITKEKLQKEHEEFKKDPKKVASALEKLLTDIFGSGFGFGFGFFG